MPELDEVTLRSFREELKVAAVPHSLVSGMSSLGGLGAAAGGLLGAYRSYKRTKDEEGSGRVGLGDVARGALLGGAGGALLGAGASRIAPGLGDALAQAPLIGGPARLVQRQVHGLTGWQPTGGIEAVRGGAYGAKKGLEAAHRAVDKARVAATAAQEAQDAGLTSLPDYLTALRQNPKGTISKAFKESWHGSSPVGKAITMGLPAYEAASAAFGEENGEGPGKAERVGRGLLPAAAGTVTGSLPYSSQLLVGGALGAVGGAAGRAVDKIRGRKVAPPHPHIEPSMGPSEVRATPAAMMGPGAGSTGGSPDMGGAA